MAFSKLFETVVVVNYVTFFPNRPLYCEKTNTRRLYNWVVFQTTQLTSATLKLDDVEFFSTESPLV